MIDTNPLMDIANERRASFWLSTLSLWEHGFDHDFIFDRSLLKYYLACHVDIYTDMSKESILNENNIGFVKIAIIFICYWY